jgi:hypothetical protein
MGGGGNGDSRRNEQMNTSDLVFILNPNKRPFLTPKFCGVEDCMISSAFYQAHPQPQAYQPLSTQEYQPLSPRGYELDSPQEYQLSSPQGYQLTSPQEYQLNYQQGYQLNSPQGYQLNSSVTTDESISSLEFPYSSSTQPTASPGYSSSSFPMKDDSGGFHPSSTSPQKDDSGDDKHIPLANRRLMNHNKPGEKELLPRRRKRRIE